MELLGLVMFIDMRSNPKLHDNQQHLSLLSEEALNYEGA